MKKNFTILIALLLCSNTAFAEVWSGSGYKGKFEAKEVTPSTTNFNHNLSTADNTVQKALDTLDNLIIPSGITIDSTTISSGTDLCVLFQKNGKVSQSQFGKFDPDGNGSGGGLFIADGGAGYPGFQINFETSQVAKIYWDNDLGFTHFDSAAQVAFGSNVFLGDTALMAGYGVWSSSSISLFNSATFNVGFNENPSKVNMFSESGDGLGILSVGDANLAELFKVAGSTSSSYTISFGDVDVENADSLFTITNNSFTFLNGIMTVSAGIKGTATNDSATAGNVGQVSTSTVTIASGTSLTTATAANIRTLSLTAGDWMVSGNVNFGATTATVTGTSAGISSTSATLPTDGTEVYSGVQVTVVSETDSVTLPAKEISLASTTTIYLVGKSTFSAGSVKAGGSITAVRIR